MAEPVSVLAVGWLLARLRADAESGLWSGLKGLVVGDPLTAALERVTDAAIDATVRASPGGDSLSDRQVGEVVAVLGQLWQGLVLEASPPGESLLGRLMGVVADAMAACAAPVEGLGSEVSSLAVLERDYDLVLDPEMFGRQLGYSWQRGVRDAALTTPALGPLAGELRAEIGHELEKASSEAVLAKLAELPTARMLSAIEAQVRKLTEAHPVQLPGVGQDVGFPQFVGVPDRNRFFVGRDQELERLADAVADAGRTVITQVAAGLGGVGKTTLAAEFCHRERSKVDVVRWLPAEAREPLVGALTAMGPALGLNLAGLAAEDAVAAVRQWFETTDRSWLLVFDNVEAPGVLDGLVPTSGNGRVLVTSRYRDWSRQGMQVLRVDVLAHDDAVELLGQLTGRTGPEMDGAGDLVDWLGGLALAVEQAGAFCQQTGWDFPRYQAHLEQRAGELLARNPAALQRVPGGADQDMVVLTVWDNSLEHATKAAPGAKTVMGVLAYLGADLIPRALLSTPPAEGEALLHDGDELWVDDALASLARFSLVELHRDDDQGPALAVSVHRLLQEVTRLSHDNATAIEGATTAIRLIRRAWPADSTHPTTWPLCQALEAHLTDAHAHAAKLGIEHETQAWTLDRYGTYLRSSGNPAAAPHIHEQAVHTQAQLGHQDDTALLTCNFNLALSYQSAGRVAEAIELLERVVAGMERIKGADHHDTLNSRGNLASSYWSAGRLAEAIELLERVVAGMERILGEDHHDTLNSRGNLASLYWSAGRVAEAIVIEERLVAGMERILGEDHPDTLTSRNNLASSYRSAGRVAEAIVIEEQVVADGERILGEDHPHTLTSRSNLASSYQSAGRVAEAVELRERVLAYRERILGEDHPDTLNSRNNLAHSYWSAGRVAEAVELLERVVADMERILGEDHPDTLNSRNNLAHSYWSAGRVAEAIELQEQVVADSERIQGTDHPDTLASRRALNEWRS